MSLKRKINQLDKKNNFIRSWDGICDASKYYEDKSGNIGAVLDKRKPGRITALGFKWEYANENFENEIWKGDHWLYKRIEASSEGRLKYLKNGRITRGSKNPKVAYYYVGVHDGIKSKNKGIHIVIAGIWWKQEYFDCLNRCKKGKPQVDHIDEDESNNKPSNLQWVTPAEHATLTVKRKNLTST